MKQEWKQQLDKKMRLEFNFNSNHIEGNTLTYGETVLLLIFDQTRGDHSMREYEEMKAHDAALELVTQWAKDKEKPLSEADIKNLNKIILVRPFWKDAITPEGMPTRRLIQIGAYKAFPNSVRLQNGEMFEYATPFETPIKMSELMTWFRAEEEKNELHPMELAALFHYKFVRIHPFDDGNGRVARLLMNYILLKHDLPPVIIKSLDKKNYLNALNRADAGFLDDFTAYIAQQLVWSLNLFIKAAKGESIEEPEDVDKELVLLQRELRSNEDVITKVDIISMLDTLEHTIFPFIKSFERGCDQFGEFFMETQKNVEISLINGGKQIYHFPQYEWKQVSQDLHNKLVNTKRRLQRLTYSQKLLGFKKSIIAHNLEFQLTITFNDYNYSIQSEDGQGFLFSYQDHLSEEEIRKIISPKIKSIIEHIRQLNTP